MKMAVLFVLIRCSEEDANRTACEQKRSNQVHKVKTPVCEDHDNQSSTLVFVYKLFTLPCFYWFILVKQKIYTVI